MRKELKYTTNDTIGMPELSENQDAYLNDTLDEVSSTSPSNSEVSHILLQMENAHLRQKLKIITLKLCKVRKRI